MLSRLLCCMLKVLLRDVCGTRRKKNIALGTHGDRHGYSWVPMVMTVYMVMTMSTRGQNTAMCRKTRSSEGVANDEILRRPVSATGAGRLKRRRRDSCTEEPEKW